MKGLFLFGVTCVAVFLVEINFRPERAHATELRNARCKKAVSVVAARDTSILMLARAKSDTVFAGGEERILSSAMWQTRNSMLTMRRTPGIDSFLLQTRNLRAFGQTMVADTFVGPGSDRVRAAFASLGSREIVVVPWSYGGFCDPFFWSQTARFATPEQDGFYVLQLRPDSLWVGRRPTFDAIDAELYTYAPGIGIPGPERRFSGDANTTRGPEPRQLFEMYVRGPALQQDEWQTLLGVQQITKDIALSRVAWARGTFVVNLDGPLVCPSRNQLPTLLSDMKIQVWLLQASGTVLAQEREPTHVAAGNAGCTGNPSQFWFKENGADPIAVVIKIDSTMIIREINRVFRK